MRILRIAAIVVTDSFSSAVKVISNKLFHAYACCEENYSKEFLERRDYL